MTDFHFRLLRLFHLEKPHVFVSDLFQCPVSGVNETLRLKGMQYLINMLLKKLKTAFVTYL